MNVYNIYSNNILLTSPFLLKLFLKCAGCSCCCFYNRFICWLIYIYLFDCLLPL